MMNPDLAPAIAFGTQLRDNHRAAQFYDQCTPAQRQAILLQLHKTPLEDMKQFVEQLPTLGLDSL